MQATEFLVRYKNYGTQNKTRLGKFKVSKDYIITEDGHLYLMYQPYELDCYAAGVTYVKVK